MHYIIGRFAKVYGASNVECDFLNPTQELGKNSMCSKSIALTKEHEEWSAGQWAARYFMPLGAMAGVQMRGCFMLNCADCLGMLEKSIRAGMN